MARTGWAMTPRQCAHAWRNGWPSGIGLSASIGKARTHDMLQKPADIDACRKAGVAALRELEAALVEARLRGDAFLAGNRPTLADIACFPHAMLAPDGGISTDPLPDDPALDPVLARPAALHRDAGHPPPA